MIKIPQNIIDSLPNFAKRIRTAFKKNKIGKPVLIGRVNLGKRRVYIVAAEIFQIYDPVKTDSKGRPLLVSRSKRTLAAYMHEQDLIFVYRSAVKPSLGPKSLERYLAHEIAHALDKDRLAKVGISAPKGDGQRFSDEYACTPVEFEAEMSAIEAVEIPFIVNNYAAIAAQYLNCISAHVGSWGRNKKLVKVFTRRLVEALKNNSAF